MPTPTVSALGERALIARIRARLPAPPWLVVGAGDDAAVFTPVRGTCDVVTVDAQVEGVHFDRRFVPPRAIGHRALAVNLSDLAAMGALPRAALLSLMLPPDLELDTFDGILDGLLDHAATHQVALIGGNITSTSGPLVLDVTALGSVRARRVLSRSGARPGDVVYVTGSLGAAAIGLDLLRRQTGHDRAVPATFAATAAAVAQERYLHPSPRVRAGLLLSRNRAASSCMDLSDGLADGLRQIADASVVGMRIEAEALPTDTAVQAWHQASGGDPLATVLSVVADSVMKFTCRPSQHGRLRHVRRQIGDLAVTRIGVVTNGRGVVIAGAAGEVSLPPGFEHFR